MLRISKQADYGLLILGHFAKEPGETVLSARELAERTHVPPPMASKVLKTLARAGLLESVRGMHGGYRLTRPPEDVTVGAVIVAADGPIAVTVCAPGDHAVSECPQEPWCPVRGSWQRLNDAIREALDRVTLAEMTCPVANPVSSFAGHENRSDV